MATYENTQIVYITSESNIQPCQATPMTDTIKSIVVNAKTTVQPGQYDVLCNRKSMAFNHIGNRRFWVIVENHASSYAEATGRSERSLMVHSIVKTIQGAGGRFLTKTTSGTWDAEASNVKCREKVGHALRSAIIARKSKEERTIYDVIIGENVKKSSSYNSFSIKKLQEKPKRDLLHDAPPYLITFDRYVYFWHYKDVAVYSRTRILGFRKFVRQ